MIDDEKKMADEPQQQEGHQPKNLKLQQQNNKDEHTTSNSHHIDSHAHHSNILRSMLERAVANRFSSKPIDMEKNRIALQQQELRRQVEAAEKKDKVKHLAKLTAEEDSNIHNSIQDISADLAAGDDHHFPNLTISEQAYLEALLEAEDPDSIRQATMILSDHSLFPPEDDASSQHFINTENVEETILSRRDSKVQRLLFRMHEIGRGKSADNKNKNNNSSSSNSKRRLGWNERREGSIVLESQTSMSSLLDDNWKKPMVYCPQNSVVTSSVRDNRNDEDDDDILDNTTKTNLAEEYPGVPANRSTSSSTSQDISSWLDGRQQQEGVEVTKHQDGDVLTSAKITAESFFKTSFAILGTAADDAACHPHVLSPPLMESLLEFVPETLSDYHFWLKYSLVRDGPNLFTLLRHVRASTRTILAIETTDGVVFGCFTSQPWRLVSNLMMDPQTKSGEEIKETKIDDNDEHVLAKKICNNSDEEAFYGSKDSFLWKMRQSRFESQALVRSATVEQAILMESELAVYPFTGSNNFVQHCSVDDGIGLGENAAAIRLDPSLRSGSTAASDTFGNPCLLDAKETGSRSFQVANLEVWTLTPHDTVQEAEQLELTAFFQQSRDESRKKLDILGILVGGPKYKR